MQVKILVLKLSNDIPPPPNYPDQTDQKSTNLIESNELNK